MATNTTIINKAMKIETDDTSRFTYKICGDRDLLISEEHLIKKFNVENIRFEIWNSKTSGSPTTYYAKIYDHDTFLTQTVFTDSLSVMSEAMDYAVRQDLISI